MKWRQINIFFFLALSLPPRLTRPYSRGNKTDIQLFVCPFSSIYLLIDRLVLFLSLSPLFLLHSTLSFPSFLVFFSFSFSSFLFFTLLHSEKVLNYLLQFHTRSLSLFSLSLIHTSFCHSLTHTYIPFIHSLTHSPRCTYTLTLQKTKQAL